MDYLNTWLLEYLDYLTTWQPQLSEPIRACYIIPSFLAGNILARIAPIKEGRGNLQGTGLLLCKKYWWFIEAWSKYYRGGRRNDIRKTCIPADQAIYREHNLILRWPVTKNTLSPHLYTSFVKERLQSKDIWFFFKESDYSRLCPEDDQIPLYLGHNTFHHILSFNKGLITYRRHLSSHFVNANLEISITKERKTITRCFTRLGRYPFKKKKTVFPLTKKYYHGSGYQNIRLFDYLVQQHSGDLLFSLNV